ncbi:MAG TPA: hypothetical protein VGB64_08535 [Actinomycetota bacterium]
MRYLTLAADYTQSALRDDHLGAVVPEEVGLAGELGDRIRDWNTRYRGIIPLSPEQRAEAPAVGVIEELDQEGLSLAREIAESQPDLKVRYYSEGHLRYVP